MVDSLTNQNAAKFEFSIESSVLVYSRVLYRGGDSLVGTLWGELKCEVDPFFSIDVKRQSEQVLFSFVIVLSVDISFRTPWLASNFFRCSILISKLELSSTKPLLE